MEQAAWPMARLQLRICRIRMWIQSSIAKATVLAYLSMKSY